MYSGVILFDLLRPDSGTPLIECETGTLSRAEARRQATALGKTIGDSRLVLLQSDDAGEILGALAAAQTAGCSLLLAHATLPESQLSVLTQTLGVDTLLRAGGVVDRTELSTNSAPRCIGNPGEGAAAPCALKPRSVVDSRILLMTSGTTGLPKVAEHTIASLVSRIAPSAGVALNRQAKWLLTYQPTTFAGIQVQLTALLTEGTIVVPPARTPDGFWRACTNHSVTHVSGTPTFWRSLLITSGGKPLPSLRQITLGGEAVDQATLDRLKSAFPHARITHIYASTEAGALFAVHDRLAGFPAAWLETGVDDVKLRVRDEQLEVWSPRRMVRYSSGQPVPVTADGWLLTSDLVRVDGDRVLFAGRTDTILNVGGAKVLPQEIEAFLLGIDGVAEAKVRGIANPITGQLVAADIVITPGRDAEEVRRTVLARSREELPRNRAPRRVNIVPAIAVANSGKKTI